MNPFRQVLTRKLEEREKKNALRTLVPFNPELSDFSSNDYLGFASETVNYPGPGGSTGSRLVTGDSGLAHEAEHQIAKFFGSESALFFSSGYSANLGLISCIAGRGDTILYDELCHASIRDGIRLSSATSWKFRHNDAEDLRAKTNRATGKVFIVTESLFSMDGDLAPLKAIRSVAMEKGCALILDEAHSGGIYGEHGEGLSREGDPVLARVFTFGKAFGAHGAAVTGSTELIRYLLNFSRPFIYSTAPPPETYRLILKRLEEVRNAVDRRKNLFALIAGSPFHQESPIGKIILPGNTLVKKAAAELEARGILAKPILHPTVPEGSERLRICLHSFNNSEELEQLAGIINQMH